MADIASLSDDQLIHLLKKDDWAAFTAIYDRYGKTLMSFAAAGSRLNDIDDASDVLHDLFIWLWEERTSLHITSSLKSYLFTALRNRIIDHIRKNNTRQQYVDLLQELAERYEHSIEQQLDAKELSKLLENSLEELPARVRQIYRLSRQDHLSIKEIAERLNISEQTVKNQLTTALKHLRQSIITVIFFMIWFGFIGHL